MSEMADIKPEAGAEGRVSPRTNLLLSATAEAGGIVIPVRIRNLSETGAMLEGNGLPDAGLPLVIRRGDLQISAVVAWAAGSRRGVRFDGPTPVSEWTGGKPKPLDCTGLRDQRRVDAIQADTRLGSPSPTPAEPGPAEAAAQPATFEQLDARLAGELAYVQRLLESLGDALISEPIVVQRHARVLQSIDLSSQILAHVASILVAEDRGAVIQRIGMDDLRARLMRKAVIPD
jgi:hypothetical protein